MQYEIKTIEVSVVKETVCLLKPSDTAKFMRDVFESKHRDQEAFYVICLNTKNRILGSYLVSLGTLNGTMVHPRDIFKHAIGCEHCGKRASASIILAHNHPSGDTTPSPEDIKFTAKLKSSCDIMGIQLLDHVIVGTGHHSMRENGDW